VNLKCTILTGDESLEAFSVWGTQVLVTTPEKLDSVSRHWRKFDFFKKLGLMMIDEVHLLSEAPRGATLESLVSRIHFIARETFQPVRMIAVSATAPNIETLGKWLGAPVPEGVLIFGPAFRPVPLDIVVEGYGGTWRQNDFMFERTLDQYIPKILEQHSQGKPSLIFCTSRKGCKELALKLTNLSEPFELSMDKLEERRTLTSSIVGEPQLVKSILNFGAAWHHAGLSAKNCETVEEIFRRGLLAVLSCTSTLAQGVNLPAHLVIIKNTKQYHGKGRGMEDIPASMLLQMVGRAGRKGYDSSGVAVIMTQAGNESKYENLFHGTEPIRSVLEGNMREQIINEIVIGSIRTRDDAYTWLESTFLYHSSLEGNRNAIEKLITEHLEAICNSGCGSKTSLDGQTVFEPTELASIMSRKYLRLRTILCFRDSTTSLAASPSVEMDSGFHLVLNTLSFAKEFDDFSVRRDQKKFLNEVNWKVGRFKNKTGKQRVDSVASKVFQLTQAQLGHIPILDGTLRLEAGAMIDEYTRLTYAYLEYLKTVPDAIINLHAHRFLKCLLTKSWPEIGELFQLEGVGSKAVEKLHSLNINTLQQLVENADSETLAREIGPGRLKKAAAHADRILANAVYVEATYANFERLIVKLEPLVGSGGTGFMIFVVDTELKKLVHQEYLLPMQHVTITLVKQYQQRRISVYCIHPKFHGIDVSMIATETQNVENNPCPVISDNIIKSQGAVVPPKPLRQTKKTETQLNFPISPIAKKAAKRKKSKPDISEYFKPKDTEENIRKLSGSSSKYAKAPLYQRTTSSPSKHTNKVSLYQHTAASPYQYEELSKHEVKEIEQSLDAENKYVDSGTVRKLTESDFQSAFF